jgi:plastocyanin
MNVKDRRGRWFAAPAALAVLVVALLASASAGAQNGEDSDWPSVNGTLDGQRFGTDGPGFTITMSKKTVPAGTYVITIRDRSAIHNLHLTGPGVDKRTSLGKVYTTTWKVTLKKGTYKFVCDPHAAIMKGTLEVT